ncbi:hypothetical protein [Thermoleophilum album]|uniref:hypothetical protein n=1 Tax=Thermoleophilum album TaxID=29539 RepID=UPI0015A6FBD5|nr:hypothetical protein [Thermoleophilum album]
MSGRDRRRWSLASDSGHRRQRAQRQGYGERAVRERSQGSTAQLVASVRRSC